MKLTTIDNDSLRLDSGCNPARTDWFRSTASRSGQSPSDAHISDNIRTLFDCNVVSIAQAAGYTFTYHQVAGADYTQVG